MSRRGIPIVGALSLLLVMATSPVAAVPPTKTAGPEPSHVIKAKTLNLRAVSERNVAPGLVLDTFEATQGSETAEVSVVGSAGSSVSLDWQLPTKDHLGRVSVSVTHDTPKTPSPVKPGGETATASSVESTSPRVESNDFDAVQQLVSLGMDPVEAQQEFGDFDQPPVRPTAMANVANPRAGTPVRLNMDTTTPWATDCNSFNWNSGKLQAYGCSNLYRYVTPSNSSDWWFDTKYKATAHSNDTSWFSPERIKHFGWALKWSSGNIMYDWDPYQKTGLNCNDLTVHADSPYGGISYTTKMCGEDLKDWQISGTSSGGMWDGTESGTDSVPVIGVQSLHNPPSAAASRSNYSEVYYCDQWCPFG